MRVPLRFRLYAAVACLRGEIQAKREVLPSRRENAETVKFEFGNFRWHASSSRYDDGRLAEVFLAGAKTGELLRCMNRDSAILVSLALQHGCPEETIRSALGRDAAGAAETPICAALDALSGREIRS